MRVRFARLSVAAVLAAVGGAALAAAQQATAPATAPTAFRVAIILATRTEPTQEHITRVFTRANVMLAAKTGQQMVVTETVNAGPGDATDTAEAYLNAKGPNAPDGIIVLSDDEEARQYGAYSLSLKRPQGSTNRFPSPEEGADKVYLSVVDLFKVYQRCGYDDELNRVSETSQRGECRGRRGLSCVDNGTYWMCPNATTDLNAEPDYFMACALVHEFIHPFGALGDGDHYSTRACRVRTGMSRDDANNLRLEQQSCGICPDLYSKFKPAGGS